MITVVGSLNMDMIVRAPRAPLPGETLMGRSFETAGGGKGSNQALAAARLGAETSMVGCIGNDDFGRQLSEELKEAHVDCSLLEIRKEADTGVAFITVTDSGENSIILVSGANALPNESLVEKASGLFAKSESVLFQLEIPAEAVEMGLKLAREKGCRTVLTPSPARALSPEAWKQITCLVLNETELAFYCPSLALSSEEKPSMEETLAAARQLLARGVEMVAVTLGRRGGVVVTPAQTIPYDAFPVESVDSTGAGDTFCSALTVGLTEGMPLERAVRFAAAAGALACTRHGAHPALPWRDEVDELLKK